MLTPAHLTYNDNGPSFPCDMVLLFPFLSCLAKQAWTVPWPWCVCVCVWYRYWGSVWLL